MLLALAVAGLSGCLRLERAGELGLEPAQTPSGTPSGGGSKCSLSSTPETLFSLKSTDISGTHTGGGIFSSIQKTSDGTLYVALSVDTAAVDDSYLMVYRSQNGGASWTELTRTRFTSEYTVLMGFAVHDDGRIILTADRYVTGNGYSADILYSSNFGATWSTHNFQSALNNSTWIEAVYFTPSGTLLGFGGVNVAGAPQVAVFSFSGGTPSIQSTLTDGVFNDAVVFQSGGPAAVDSVGRIYVPFSISQGGYHLRIVRSTDSSATAWEFVGKSAAESLPASYHEEMTYASPIFTQAGKLLTATWAFDGAYPATDSGLALRSFSNFGATTLPTATPFSYTQASKSAMPFSLISGGKQGELVMAGTWDMALADGKGGKRFALVSRDDGATWSSLADRPAAGADAPSNMYSSGVFDKQGNLLMLAQTEEDGAGFTTIFVEKFPCQ